MAAGNEPSKHARTPTIREPRLLNLESRGYIQGVTLKDSVTGKELCYYYGGIPYAEPALGDNRWRKPRELAACYRYGTREAPGGFDAAATECPTESALHSKKRRFKEGVSEDCLQTIIWVPAGETPADGWPVYFYIHGGFLQTGTPNRPDPTALLSETPVKAIIVKPGYRLNIFGFLASKALSADGAPGSAVANFGFWDIRLALEWTHKHISYFGGNAANITVGGYSAGAHAAFHQLGHEVFFVSPEKRIIKRLVMHSNGPGLPPKDLDEVQLQFDMVLSRLVPEESALLRGNPQKLVARLRQFPAETLIETIKALPLLHQFRAVADDCFVSRQLFSSILDGRFARFLLAHDIPILIGECTQEHWEYAKHRTPSLLSRNSLIQRFSADYPSRVAIALVDKHALAGKLPLSTEKEQWKRVFGEIYADAQIHASQRGFLACLSRHGAQGLVKRYQIDFRSQSLSPKSYPVHWGATHGSDLAIWFFGNGRPFPESHEKEVLIQGLLKGFQAFITGKKLGDDWGDGMSRIRVLGKDGTVKVLQDDAERMAWGVDLWTKTNSVVESTDTGVAAQQARL